MTMFCGLLRCCAAPTGERNGSEDVLWVAEMLHRPYAKADWTLLVP